jgi:polyisoprenoid-binding protein YceI
VSSPPFDASARIACVGVDQDRQYKHGHRGRDNHLKTPDFFDAAKYPEITFKSKRIEKKGKNLILTGDFSMHGVTKEISFPFSMVGNCYDKKSQKATLPCGFSAKLSLDRRDYGINYARKDNADFIGHIVEVDLNMLATQPRTEKK